MLTIAGDASRDIASNSSAAALIAMIILLGAAAIGAQRWTRRGGADHSAVAWFAAFGSIAAIVSLTLLREGVQFGFRPTRVLAWTTTGWDRLAEENLFGSSQFLLNIVLFVPAGIAWTWVTGRAVRSLAGLIALTVLVESVQGVTGAGASDITDIAANTCGALLGVGVAATAAALLRQMGVETGTAATPRRRAVVAAVLVITVAIGALTLITGADRHQADIRRELITAFGEISYEDVDAVVRADVDNPEPFPAAAPFTDFGQIDRAISVRTNGARYSDEQIELRWPALFFGFRRCVSVIWTPTTVDFRNMSGSACTDFLS